jgi:hypothetical protein
MSPKTRFATKPGRDKTPESANSHTVADVADMAD